VGAENFQRTEKGQLSINQKNVSAGEKRYDYEGTHNKGCPQDAAPEKTRYSFRTRKVNHRTPKKKEAPGEIGVERAKRELRRPRRGETQGMTQEDQPYSAGGDLRGLS